MPHLRPYQSPSGGPSRSAPIGRYQELTVRSAVRTFGVVDSSDVSRWFREYLDAFASCGRGESDLSSEVTVLNRSRRISVVAVHSR